MSNSANYRVKVDLTKYYNDARRFSWIYVNCTNVRSINHLKIRIKNVFDLQEPFHLLLNGNEYLPPDEDVHIINENEIIVVEPGSGISNVRRSQSAMSMPTSDIENGFVKDISTTDSAAPYQHKTKHEPRSGTSNDNQASNSSVANVSKFDTTMYHTILDTTGIESSSDSKQLNDSVEMHFDTRQDHGEHLRKRKRIRRKKVSKSAETSFVQNNDQCKAPSFNKPKIVNSFILPSGTHIRFDNVNEIPATKIENEADGDDEKSTTSFQPDQFFKKSKVEQLSSLLSLGNCSSPLTFVYNKRNGKNSSDLQLENEKTRQSSTELDNASSAKNSTCGRDNNATENFDERKKEYSNVKPEEYPVLDCKLEIGHTIAFKVLRMGKEYTPEVSGYIIARTVAYCPIKMLYTFQVLRGLAEIEGPTGKFSLPEDETDNNKNDTVEFNISQLIEPRLIDRK